MEGEALVTDDIRAGAADGYREVVPKSDTPRLSLQCGPTCQSAYFNSAGGTDSVVEVHCFCH